MTSNDPAVDEINQIAIRLPVSLIAAVDARAESTNRSRNAWVQRALSYIITELPTEATDAERIALRKRWKAGDL